MARRDTLTLDQLLRTAIQMALVEYSPAAYLDDEGQALAAAAEDRALERVQLLLTPLALCELAADIVEPAVGLHVPARRAPQHQAGVIVPDLAAGLGALALVALGYVGVRAHSAPLVLGAICAALLWGLLLRPAPAPPTFERVRFPDDEPALRADEEGGVCQQRARERRSAHLNGVPILN